MKASEMRQQTKPTLQTMLRELLTKQFRLRMQQGSDSLRANHQLKQLRREVARVKTIMTELEKKGE